MYNEPVQLTSANISHTLSYGRSSTIKILQKISAPNMEAVFLSVPRYVGAQLERLNNIQIFDKRDGTSKLARIVTFLYSINNQRAFLSSVSISAGCLTANYAMEYYPGALPAHDFSNYMDDWDFYNQSSLQSFLPYSESAVIGTLKKITYPLKGYDVFFYEPHQYVSNGVNFTGAGIRLRRMVSYDGVSSSHDRIKDYQYLGTDGKSSGKLQYRAQHNFSFVHAPAEDGPHPGGITNVPSYYLRYRDYVLQYPTGPASQVFTMKSSTELSHFGPLNGSAVAYSRVTISDQDAGYSVYEFDLPASYGDVSANNNEWQASTVSVARPPAGAFCYDLGSIQTGAYQYPYPPNPNYQFAQALLTKSTDYRQDGIVVRDVIYNYQRIYGNGSSIRKLYGLALEAVPTYYYNGSAYVDANMFLYSRYEIFTDVKTELSYKTETVYNSTDLSKKTSITTNYFYDSPNHRELTRTEVTSSDGSVIRNTNTYSKDYLVTSAGDGPSAALSLLNSSTYHQNLPVESITTRISGSVGKTIGAAITLYQVVGGKVYPGTQFTYTSVDGVTGFTSSSINAGSTFQFEQTKYVLQKTFSAFDNFGNATEVTGRDRITNSITYGYNGTLPIISVSNAGASEIKYSDFETSTPADFLITWSPLSYTTGRNNFKGVNVPAGGEFSNNFFGSLVYKQAAYYILSCWIKASTAGTLSVLVSGPSSATTVCPFFVSADYRYYRFRIPVRSVVGNVSSFVAKVWSSVPTQIDDIAFYPEYADFNASTYLIPNGKSSTTDSRGITTFFDYDVWNRLKAVYDQDRNVVKKYDYTVRP